MEKKYKKIIVKIFLILIFATSMGYLEAVIANYDRMILGISVDYDLKQLPKFTPRHLFLEQTREISTIIMLFSFGLLIGKTLREKLTIFMLSISTWDLFYYISLYIILRWPSSLFTTDLLFLVPMPWIAPVILPVTISIMIITFSILSLVRQNYNDNQK